MIDPTLDARAALLFELFDDAGLFPPASLPMHEALAAHRLALDGPYAWILARFVCPASRLHEITDPPARLSVILDAADAADALEHLPAGTDAVEARSSAAEIPRLAKSLEAAGFLGSAFAEVAPADGWEEALEAIAAAGGTVALGAKIRCGGQTVPATRQVAGFLVRCRDLRIRAKATAGLHHPIRSEREHGFLNLAVAGTLACAHSLDLYTIEQIVDERDPQAFTITRAAVGWREFTATAADATAARAQLFAGIGSCSFDEPVQDLTALGVLPL